VRRHAPCKVLHFWQAARNLLCVKVHMDNLRQPRVISGNLGHPIKSSMRSTMNPLLSLILACLLGVSPLAGQAQTPEAEALLARALALTPDAKRGEAEFADQSCTACHRKDAFGRATTPTPRLSGQHAAVIVKQVLDIRSGLRQNPPMQPMVTEAELSLQTLVDIAAHLQSLPVAGNIAKGPGSGVERGKKLFDSDCSGCHGAGGEGNVLIFAPMVAAQHYTYLLRELGFIRDGKRGNSNPAMASLMQTYNQDDLQAVADYLAQLPPPQPR